MFRGEVPAYHIQLWLQETPPVVVRAQMNPSVFSMHTLCEIPPGGLVTLSYTGFSVSFYSFFNQRGTFRHITIFVIVLRGSVWAPDLFKQVKQFHTGDREKKATCSKIPNITPSNFPRLTNHPCTISVP